MANNRLMLKCDVCGKEIMLGKRMGTGYYRAPDASQLNAFYDQHETSCFGKGISMADHYSLEYEMGRER